MFTTTTPSFYNHTVKSGENSVVSLATNSARAWFRGTTNFKNRKPLLWFTTCSRTQSLLFRNLNCKPSASWSHFGVVIFSETSNRRIGHIICRITYGYSVQSADDPFLAGPIAAMVNFGKATTPGNFMVDFIPARKTSMLLFFFWQKCRSWYPLVVKHLPRWMPGSGFLKLAEEWHKVMWDAANDPFQWCKDNLVYASSSFIATVQNNIDF